MYERYFKRIMDFLLSFIALIVLSPIILIVAVLVRIKLGSPVIFRQQRPGLNERIFTMYKFRTMTDSKNKDGELLPDSLRLSKFGKFLRSTSLDELPELFNILVGDMSIIGPRPLLEKYLPYYTETEKIRHSVRPGLSGLAQINGRNNLDWNNRLGLDIDYVNSITLKLDLYIILHSFLKVLRRENITIIDQATLKDLDVDRSSTNGDKKIKI